MFLWQAAPTLLSRKGYARDVRRESLALALWVLAETHAAGEERSLAPPRPKSRRKSSIASAAADVAPGSSPSTPAPSVAPNLAVAFAAENLVGTGGVASSSSSGDSGGGVTDLNADASAVGDSNMRGRSSPQSCSGAGERAVAVPAAITAEVFREQYRSAHLSLVRKHERLTALRRSGICSLPSVCRCSPR